MMHKQHLEQTLNDLTEMKRMIVEIHKLHFAPTPSEPCEDIKAKLKASILMGVKHRHR